MKKGRFAAIVAVMFMMLIVSGTAEAATKGACDAMDLSWADQAEAARIRASCIDNVSSTVTLDNANKWSEVSLQFAKAVGVAATELGVAANTFLATPAGILTACVIIWSIAGQEILLVLMLLVLWIFYMWAVTRVILDHDIVVVERRLFSFRWSAQKRVRRIWAEQSDTAQMTAVILSIVMVIGTIILTANII